MPTKSTFVSPFVVATILFAFAGVAGAAIVGEPAPTFTLTDLDGVEHSLEQYRGRVVVLEWINPNCPYSRRHSREETMIELADREDSVFLAVNSTHPGSSDFLETAEHRAFNEEHGIEYPVLYDLTGEVGHAYDAKTTPHMYIVDEDGTLLYNGAIDDDPRGRLSPKERDNYVAGGLDDLADGGPVDPATTKPYGCTVKYGN